MNIISKEKEEPSWQYPVLCVPSPLVLGKRCPGLMNFTQPDSVLHSVLLLVVVLEVAKGTILIVKRLKDVLCHSTDWLNIFMSDLDMKNRSMMMALFDDKIILGWPSVVE